MSFLSSLGDFLETGAGVYSQVKQADSGVNSNVTSSNPETAQEPPDTVPNTVTLITPQNIALGVALVFVLLALLLLFSRGK